MIVSCRLAVMNVETFCCYGMITQGILMFSGLERAICINVSCRIFQCKSTVEMKSITVGGPKSLLSL